MATAGNFCRPNSAGSTADSATSSHPAAARCQWRTRTPPMITINPLSSESERGEQHGFANLINGTFGMFRNSTAHEPRIH
ncbi:TIGR02391 family protein [Sphingobium sp. ZW T5_29]|uniref:TIGR02391 family protein n=1 Tax=Sphingobium sp. ZW T5_29 TaxID=3378077 RepID=UPI00385223BC